jgi:hypothetical protein
MPAIRDVCALYYEMVLVLELGSEEPGTAILDHSLPYRCIFL